MGLFDRLRKSPSDSSKPGGQAPKQKKAEEAFFLDADASTSWGNTDYMKESKSIRHTFPSSLDNPGFKESVINVSFQDSTVEKESDGLGGKTADDGTVRVGSGVPKAVKKTFAQKIDTDSLKKRQTGAGSRTGVNAFKDKSIKVRERNAEPNQSITEEQTSSKPQSEWDTKPGSIDPFRNMVRQLNG